MRSRALGAAMLLIAAAVTGQENSPDIINAMKDKAVVLDLTARVVERDVTEMWNSETSKVTIPGRPVTLRLVGANIVVAVQFTPYRKEDGKNILVAQGQVWVTTKDEGILYYTSIQTLPIEYGERVYFFPLGQKKDNQQARIEVQLVLSPYTEGDQVKKPAKEDAPKQGKPTAASKTEPTKTEPPRQDKATPESKTETAITEAPLSSTDQSKQQAASIDEAAGIEKQAKE